MSDAIQLYRHAYAVAEGDEDLDKIATADQLIENANKSVAKGDKAQADELLDQSMTLSKEVIHANPGNDIFSSKRF